MGPAWVSLQNTLAQRSLDGLLEALAPKVPPTGRVVESASKRFNGCMDQTMLAQELKTVGLSLEEACQAMYWDTGRVVRPKNVRKQFQRNGHLSEIYSTAFAYFFREQRKKRKNVARC